jgi:hypothetical protein
MNEEFKAKNDKIFDDEISLNELLKKIKKFLKNLLKYKTLLIVASFIGILLAFIYYKNQTIKYKAEINFVLDEEKNNSIGGAAAIAGQFGLDLGTSSGNIFSGDNLIYLFKSKPIIERTLLKPILFNKDTITLADFYLENVKPFEGDELRKTTKKHFFKNIKKEKFSINDIKLLRSIEGDILKDILDVKQKNKKISVSTIEVISNSEIFSKLLCEEIAKDVSNYYIENKIRKAKINKEILQRQVDSIRIELNNAIEGSAKAMDKIYNLNPAFLINKAPTSKRQVDIQANSAILTQLVTNLEMAKVSLRKETPLIQVIEYPEFPLEIVSISLFKSVIIFISISLIISFVVIYFLSSQNAKNTTRI